MARIHYKKRFLKGLFIAVRILFSYRLARISGVFLSRERKAALFRKLHRRNAALIKEKALEMKGVMIKVGQFLSSRKDFLPDEYIEELSELQDQVPPHDFGEIRQRIIDELGSAPEDIFSEFEKDPIAAASLGQVHRAVLKDGREAAVKVQYPGIEKIIETDIKMFEVLIYIMRGRMGWINLRVLHEEFSRIVRAELDYVQEARNAERFRLNFISDEQVVIPKVYWEFSRGKVLTLEFVGGIKITECEIIKASGVDCRRLVNLLVETYAKMIFVHGFFHCDPHPGNIFMGEGPTVVFVDFGMVQSIADSTRRNLRHYANAIVENDATGIVEALEKLGFLIEDADYAAIENVTQDLIDKYRYSTPEELKSLTVDDIGDEINNVRGVINNFQVPNYFILLIRTAGMLNGMAYRLNPDVNIIEIAKPYIREFFRGTQEESINQVINTLRKKLLEIVDLPSQAHAFIKKANRGELSFKISKSDTQGIANRLTSISDVMLLVILTVNASTAALFFAFMHNHSLSLVAAASAVLLSLFSVFRLVKK
ncbi:MAG: AarF/UbiB family protein [Dissulfurispiraceae bacterium]|jgi:predicted unusual protein kinase regulating ubiquinone biosynthesis (AarF/ABC1/UbiB family)